MERNSAGVEIPGCGGVPHDYNGGYSCRGCFEFHVQSEPKTMGSEGKSEVPKQNFEFVCMASNTHGKSRKYLAHKEIAVALNNRMNSRREGSILDTLIISEHSL